MVKKWFPERLIAFICFFIIQRLHLFLWKNTFWLIFQQCIMCLSLRYEQSTYNIINDFAFEQTSSPSQAVWLVPMETLIEAKLVNLAASM